jgi:threonylcarbamoyladenosine tRNA methylthiotransferase MtaB
MKKFFIKVFGCKVNQLEMETLRSSLIKANFLETKFLSESDFVFLHTCTVTDKASKINHKFLNKITNQKVFVTGCDLIVDFKNYQKKYPNFNFFKNLDDLYLFLKIPKTDFILNKKTRYQVLVQLGCMNNCSFCLTRVARGKHCSLPKEKIIENILSLSKRGAQEIVLTGINLASFGIERGENLAFLLKEILLKTKIPRIRLSSLGPQYLNSDFWEVYQDSRICNFLHLSVQSASNSVLKRMNRPYLKEDLHFIINKAKKLRSNTLISIDLITGFPQETDTEFLETLNFLQTEKIPLAHIFTFSPRKQTKAYLMTGQISEETKKQRRKILLSQVKENYQDFIKQCLGKTFEVLGEKNQKGLTKNGIKVKIDAFNERKNIVLTEKIIIK